MLAQCPALAHLDLSDNEIELEESEWEDECESHRLYSLAECSLTHLDLSHNFISAEVILRLRAAWIGDPLKMVPQFYFSCHFESSY